MTAVGAVLLAASVPVDNVNQRIREISDVYGLEVQSFVLPTGVWTVGWDGAPVVSLAQTYPGTLRFDQTEALFALVEEAVTGQVSPVEGMRRLEAIRAMPPRRGVAGSVTGVVVIAVGVALVLEAGGRDIAVAAGLGALVGLLTLPARGRPAYENVLPALSAFLVCGIALELGGNDLVDEPVLVITPALVTFLPGAMLTIGAIELSDGSLAAGSARLVTGAYQLLFLAFGLVVAGAAIGLDTADELGDPVVASVGWWGPWLGVGVFAVGVALRSSAPTRSIPGILVVVFVAFTAQWAMYEVVEGYVAALAGAAAGIVAAGLVERHAHGPPMLVTFTAAFWLLVPGGLGLIGVTRATAGDTGGDDVSWALLTIVGIALGVIIGRAVDRGLRLHIPRW